MNILWIEDFGGLLQPNADTLISMFLHPYMDMQIDGRLYGTLHPLRSDDYGTVAGRFSASKPNLQQVSAQEEEGEEKKIVLRILV